ncbi:unnamed protein product, partial [Effrenium voratum]
MALSLRQERARGRRTGGASCCRRPCAFARRARSGFCPAPRRRRLRGLLRGLLRASVSTAAQRQCLGGLCQLAPRGHPRQCSVACHATGAGSGASHGRERRTSAGHGLAPSPGSGGSGGSGGSELMSSLAQCSLEVLALPSFVWLLGPQGTVACLTSPMVTAADPWMQVDGLDFRTETGAATDELEGALQRMPDFAVEQMRRRLSQAGHEEVDENQEEGVLASLARAKALAWRSETLPESGERPLVTLDVNLTISPLRITLRAQQLRALQEWAVLDEAEAEAEEVPVAAALAEPAPQEPAAAPAVQAAPRLRLALSLRAFAGLEFSAEAAGGRCLEAATARGSAQDHGSVKLRLARPHLGLLSPEAAHDIVEWCEETLPGGHCKACWLRAQLAWRGEQPMSVCVSSLPIGLCVAAAPLLHFATTFSQQSRPLSTPRAPRQAGRTAAPSPLAAPASQSGPTVQLQVALGAVSLRLFAGRQSFGAPCLVACLNEASGSLGDSLQAKAVLSLSLFELAPRTEEGIELESRCLVDDLLAPCTVRLQPSGQEARVVVETIALDLGQRAHLCQLLRLAKECAAAVPPSSPTEVTEVEETSPAATTEEMSVVVRSLVLKVPGEEEGESSSLLADELRVTLGSSISGRCARLSGSLLGRHRLEAAACGVELKDDLAVSAETLKVHLVTGKFFADLRNCWPSDSQAEVSDPHPEAVEKASGKGSRTGLRLGALRLSLQPAVSSRRQLDVFFQDASLDVLPGASVESPFGLHTTQCINFNVE